MVALKTERRVFMWRIVPQPLPLDALGKKRVSGEPVAVTLDELVSLLEGEKSAGRARVFLGPGGRLLDDDDESRDETNQIYIAEIKRAADGSTFTILINRGDPNIVSPAFINTAKQTVRVEEPKEGEVPGASAHLVMAAKPTDHGHRACFEKMPHVSSSLALTAMDRIVSRALVKNPTYRFEVIGKDKKGKPVIGWKSYRPRFANHQVPSEKLIDDLDQGELSGVTLTKRKVFYAGPGVADIVSRQEEKIVLTMRPASKESMVAFIKNLTVKAKEEEYEKISFHIDQLPGDATNNPTLTLDDHDALEQLYVRAQRLTGFEDVLEQCYPAVCIEIEDKMIDLIEHGDW
jgi:hypothetical protein